LKTIKQKHDKSL
jgi:hypothetical protein